LSADKQYVTYTISYLYFMPKKLIQVLFSSNVFVSASQRVSTIVQNCFVKVSTNFHQLWHFLAQWWQ